MPDTPAPVPPAVIVRPPVLTDDGDEDKPAAVVCPHCAAVDSVLEVDRAIRWNEGELTIEDGRVIGAHWSTGDGDFHHQGFMCSSCRGAVDLPDLTDEDWS